MLRILPPRLLLVSLAVCTAYAEARVRPESGILSTSPSLASFMKEVAYGYGSARAQEKVVKATEAQKLGALLDSISVTGNYYRNQGVTGGSPSPGSPPFPDTNYSGRGLSLSASFSLSVNTFLQYEGFRITKSIQESVLLATRMRLATEAAAGHLDFYNTEVRKFYLGLILRSLTDLDNKVKNGEVKLNDANATLLQSKINETSAVILGLENQMELAALEIERLSGRRPPTVSSSGSPSLSEPLTRSLSRPESRASPQLADDPLELIFPVPATVEEAYARSSKSPAIIQAELGERSAHNKWRMGIAAFGPKFTLSVSKSITDSLYETVPVIDNNFENAVVSASLSINIQGSAITNLQANKLLEESAAITRATTVTEVKSGIAKLYPTLSLQRDQMKFSKSTMLRSAQSLSVFRHEGDAKFQEFISLVNTLNFSAQLYQQNSTQFVLTKVRIHGLMGSLLEAVEAQAINDRVDSDALP